jgi:steroid 5-alpha reductase family enzyme
VSEVLLLSAVVVVASFVVLWLVSLIVKDASIVDPFWGPSFVVITWTAYAVAVDPGGRGLLVAVLVTVWGLRLGTHLAVRNLGHGEDFRYQAMRRRWEARFGIVSLGTVFLLQAALAWVVSLPVQIAMVDGGEPGWLALAGLAVWVLGLFFEAVGDHQLRRFKRDPASQGRVMDRGLWRYTRHPNYFGDFAVWWGHFLVAIAAWSSAWTVIGPLVMSTLLLRVSGVALLEKSLTKRRPGYAEYAARTNTFFPWRPRNRHSSLEDTR